MTCESIQLSVDLYVWGITDFISREVVIFYLGHCQFVA